MLRPEDDDFSEGFVAIHANCTIDRVLEAKKRYLHGEDSDGCEYADRKFFCVEGKRIHANGKQEYISERRSRSKPNIE